MGNMSFPKIMGVVNVTPDSFSDGGNYFNEEFAIEHSLQLINDGADILDIGGESTRPGAEPVSSIEEMDRVIPVINGIRKNNEDIRISIDTTKLDVATEAVAAGASLINDISGLRNDLRLADLATESQSGLIIMHMLGSPRTMQNDPRYDNVVEDIYLFLKERIEIARKTGVEEIYADVGIGFGKTVEHNLELLRNHKYFAKLNCNMCLGISRKSFMGKTLKIDDPKERDLPTALIHALTLGSETGIIRVHNVKYIKMLKDVYQMLFDL